MKSSDKYYTGREVQRLLGITEPSLRNLVNQKKLRKVIPPGRKTGLYLKTDVDTFSAKWEAFLMAKELPKITFRIARSEDLEIEEDLDTRAIGSPGVSAKIKRTWHALNSESDYHVYYTNKLVAYLWLVPIREDIMEPFLRGEIHWNDIQPEKDIVKYEVGKPVQLYILGVASEPDVNEETRMHYMLVLLRGTGEELKKLGRKGVIITKVYARSQTPTGIAMAMHVGMKEYEPMPRTRKLVRFVLDIETSDSYLVRMYKEGLAEWKAKHEQGA
ncbi:MAG: hypothetical protein WCD86_00185 [Ktedonobacteraceae bacterium]